MLSGLSFYWNDPFIIIFRLLFFSFRHFPEITSIAMRFLLIAASIGVTFSYPNGRFHILCMICQLEDVWIDKREKNRGVNLNMIRLSMLLQSIDLIKLHIGAPSCSSPPRHGGGRGWVSSLKVVVVVVVVEVVALGSSILKNGSPRNVPSDFSVT